MRRHSSLFCGVTSLTSLNATKLWIIYLSWFMRHLAKGLRANGSLFNSSNVSKEKVMGCGASVLLSTRLLFSSCCLKLFRLKLLQFFVKWNGTLYLLEVYLFIHVLLLLLLDAAMMMIMFFLDDVLRTVAMISMMLAFKEVKRDRKKASPHVITYRNV